MVIKDFYVHQVEPLRWGFVMNSSVAYAEVCKMISLIINEKKQKHFTGIMLSFESYSFLLVF